MVDKAKAKSTVKKKNTLELILAIMMVLSIELLVRILSNIMETYLGKKNPQQIFEAGEIQ